MSQIRFAIVRSGTAGGKTFPPLIVAPGGFIPLVDGGVVRAVSGLLYDGLRLPSLRE